LDIWKDSSGKFRLTRFDWGHESSGSYVFPTLTEAVDAAQMCSRLCCIRFAIGAPLIAEELRRTLPAELGQLIGSLNIVGEDGELCINLDPRFEDQGALEAITSAAEAICRGHIGVRAQWAW
jgi:hypothetical protein